MRKCLSVLCALAALTTVAHAQNPIAGDSVRAVSVQYSHLSSRGEHLNGWQSEASWNKPSGSESHQFSIFGLDVGVSQHFGHVDRAEGGLAPGVERPSVCRTTVLGGVRLFPFYVIPVYVRAVAGYSRRYSEDVTTSSPVLGGGFGVAFPVGHHLALRPIQLDYLRFVGAKDVESGRRVSAGVSVIW